MNNKHAAILTFCNNNGVTNYGQILQCYAVCKVIEGYGYEVIVVLFQKYAIEEQQTSRNRKFKEFVEKYIPTSQLCFSIEDVERVTRDCSVLICGSDQIWHPNYTDQVWMLGFGTKEQIRISFSASGIFYDNNEVNDSCKALTRYLEKMDVITVREKVAKDILSKYTKKEIDVMQDPVFFLSPKVWDEVASGELNIDNYVLCFCLGSIRAYSLVLKRLAQLYNAQIMYIPSALIAEGRYSFMKPIFDAGPAEFITLIRNARAVCTDSYHGIAFSMIYGKDYYCLKRMDKGADLLGGTVRIDNLFQESGLITKWIKNVRDVDARYMELNNKDGNRVIYR